MDRRLNGQNDDRHIQTFVRRVAIPTGWCVKFLAIYNTTPPDAHESLS
jgi:hypothetical protein